MDETHEVGFSFSLPIQPHEYQPMNGKPTFYLFKKLHRSFCIEANFVSMMSWMKAPNLRRRFPSLQLILIEFSRRIKGSIHHSNKEMQLDHKIESESELLKSEK